MDKRLVTSFFVFLFVSCAGKPTINITKSPDALYETIEHSRKITNEEKYYSDEERCYRLFPKNQWGYEDCLAKRRPASKRGFRYEQHDEIITFPEIAPQETKHVNIK
jgi:hypothetical protein